MASIHRTDADRRLPPRYTLPVTGLILSGIMTVIISGISTLLALGLTGEFIGRCGLLPWTIAGQDEVEVAYMIDKRYWRRGLGVEAARGIRDYAFNQLGLSRLICMIDGENAASIGVAEGIGMTFGKEVVDEHGPYLIYSMSKPASE